MQRAAHLRYALSYRDLEEMMQERGRSVNHTTIYPWVQAYAPELEKRIRPHLKLANDSYRVDETRGLPSALFFMGLASGAMEGLKNCLFVFKMDSALAAAFATMGWKMCYGDWL